MIHKTWFYQSSPSSIRPRILKIKFRGSNILEPGSNILEPPNVPDCLVPPVPHDAAPASTQAVDQTQEALNSMLHPVPPPPPVGPTSTRLITVVPRRTGHRSSFSQVDGQDNNSVDDSDCSSTVADEGGPPTASSPPLQPPPPHTPSDQVWQMLDRMPWGIPKCPPSGVCYIGHGALAHSEAEKRKHRKSPYKSGDYPASNMNDQSVILQTCLDRSVNGATSQQQV